MENLGIKIIESSEKRVAVERTTRESKIKIAVEDSPRRDFILKTGLLFLDHQLEQIGWRFCMNIDASCEIRRKMMHVISEDTGLVLGIALREMYAKRMKSGANGSGFSIVAMDEARATAVVSIEGRAFAFIEQPAELKQTEFVEDMLTADMISFIEGLAQGLKATIQIKIETGRDPHHSWEAAYRALGEALKNCLSTNEWRKGTTVGIKGTLE